MAQPPLSVAIRQLEQEIGTSLFNRTSRAVELTEAGRAFLEGARRTLAEAEGAVTAAQRTGAGQLGSLRVGYSWSTRFETLPELGRAMQSERPEVELLTEELRTYQMPDALRARAIDVAIAVYPDVVGELTYQTFRRELIVAVLSSQHPFADQEELALTALADDLVLFPRALAPRLHDFYASLCRGAGFEAKQSDESSRTRWTLSTWNPSTVVLLPESVTNDLPHGTVAVRISQPTDLLETDLIWRPDERNSTLVTFIEIAAGVFSAPRSTRARG